MTMQRNGYAPGPPRDLDLERIDRSIERVKARIADLGSEPDLAAPFKDGPLAQANTALDRLHVLRARHVNGPRR